MYCNLLLECEQQIDAGKAAQLKAESIRPKIEAIEKLKSQFAG